MTLIEALTKLLDGEAEKVRKGRLSLGVVAVAGKKYAVINTIAFSIEEFLGSGWEIEHVP